MGKSWIEPGVRAVLRRWRGDLPLVRVRVERMFPQGAGRHIQVLVRDAGGKAYRVRRAWLRRLDDVFDDLE